MARPNSLLVVETSGEVISFGFGLSPGAIGNPKPVGNIGSFCPIFDFGAHIFCVDSFTVVWMIPYSGFAQSPTLLSGGQKLFTPWWPSPGVPGIINPADLRVVVYEHP
jgi:hypothetical protein